MHAGELAFEFGQICSDCWRIPVAERTELIGDGTFDLADLSPQIRIALTLRCKCFPEFLFEPLQRVRDDVGMQNALLEPGQELALKILPANQKIVFADGIPALRMHRASVARIAPFFTVARDDRDTTATL
jgi:hypothetical protein